MSLTPHSEPRPTKPMPEYMEVLFQRAPKTDLCVSSLSELQERLEEGELVSSWIHVLDSVTWWVEVAHLLSSATASRTAEADRSVMEPLGALLSAYPAIALESKYDQAWEESLFRVLSLYQAFTKGVRLYSHTLYPDVDWTELNEAL